MFGAGPSGFAGAPVTKLVFSLVLVFSASVLIAHAVPLFEFDNEVASKGELWRLVTSGLFMSAPLEFFTSLILIYVCGRMSERQYGSNKFSVLVALTLAAYVAVEVGALTLASWRIAASGPHALGLALVLLYARDVPPVWRFRVAGVALHNKYLVYALAAQCLVSTYPRCLLGALAGAAAGLAYRSRALGLCELRFPARAASLCAAVLMPLLDARPQQRQQAAAAAAAPGGAQGGRALGGGGEGAQGRYVDQLIGPGSENEPVPEDMVARDALPALAAPDPSAVATLVAMGFAEARVREALARCNNDITAATNALLDH
eukprot:m51a1_g8768 hypothetical protein (318) ;mRNA; f:153203-154698